MYCYLTVNTTLIKFIFNIIKEDLLKQSEYFYRSFIILCYLI